MLLSLIAYTTRDSDCIICIKQAWWLMLKPSPCGKRPLLSSGHLWADDDDDDESAFDSEGRAHSMQHGPTGESAREQGDADSGFDMVEDDGRGSPGSTDDTERPSSTKSGDSDYPETSTKQASTDKDTSSPESNSLLDPAVLGDFTTQALVLTVLATLVKYTTDEDEIRILYQYLAEGSVVFPKVFPVIHSLLDMKINHVLMHCHDQLILSAVQSIIQNMIASEDASQQQLHYMQSCGFGGLWRFAGPFTKNQCTAESSELFVNCLEAMVETCLPGGDEALTRAPPPDPDHPDPCDQHRYPGELTQIFKGTENLMNRASFAVVRYPQQQLAARPEPDPSVRRVAFRARLKEPIDHHRRGPIGLMFSRGGGVSAMRYRDLGPEQEKE
ncbi:unnamed protein product [Spodoptera exigua]|nr:unnamed protein product [Spodoptera exigua]